MTSVVASLSAPELVEALDGVLPQTQCTRCGYDDCRRYAVAMAEGSAGTNRCPPGGNEGVRRLSALTGTVAGALDPSCGTERPRQLAVIDESWCIGCALCLAACPVDAIAGAAKRMHTVIDVHCTGCELCVPACPVDCISLVAVTGERTGWDAWTPTQAARSRERYETHRSRVAGCDPLAQADENEPQTGLSVAPQPSTDASRRAALANALARARAARTT